MGYKVWNNYEDAERERLRALPWRQRYNWRGLTIFAVIVAAIVAACILGVRP